MENIGLTVLGEYTHCLNLTFSREKANQISGSRKQKSSDDAPLKPSGDNNFPHKRDDDDDDDDDGVSTSEKGDSVIIPKEPNITQSTQRIWPTNIDLIQLLQQIMGDPKPTPLETLIFEFDLSVEAAEKNHILLMQKFGGDLHSALHTQNKSPLSYGSEFKATSTLNTRTHF
jgi:hypothetical protein